MISVVFYKKDDKFLKTTVKGHAYQDNPGFDLVCAGVSSVMTGALNGFDELVPNSILELTQEPLISLEVKTPSTESELLFKFIFHQLKTIEEVSKDYLKIIVKEDKS